MTDYAIEDLTGSGDNKLLRINGKKILDHESYHDLFSEALGFPDFYGRNRAAWIDCMSSIDFPPDGLSQIHVGKGGTLTIHIEDYHFFRKRGAEQCNELIESSAFVNFRRAEERRRPLLALSFFK